ncbi:MAG: hypothetical protein ABW171_15055 [Steroidobacter sp.]
MSKPRKRFVAKAEPGAGWRIWDNQQHRWWGERYENLPEQLLDELNGEKRSVELGGLQRRTPRKR